MGQSSTRYIVGEIYYKPPQKNAPYGAYNLILYYTSISKTRPTEIVINYDQPPKCSYFLIDAADVLRCCHSELLLDKQTMAVSLIVRYNFWNLFKSSNEAKLLAIKVIPYIHS